jgi:hypothetical protein
MKFFQIEIFALFNFKFFSEIIYFRNLQVAAQLDWSILHASIFQMLQPVAETHHQ